MVKNATDILTPQFIEDCLRRHTSGDSWEQTPLSVREAECRDMRQLLTFVLSQPSISAAVGLASDLDGCVVVGLNKAPTLKVREFWEAWIRFVENAGEEPATGR